VLVQVTDTSVGHHGQAHGNGGGDGSGNFAKYQPTAALPSRGLKTSIIGAGSCACNLAATYVVDSPSHFDVQLDIEWTFHLRIGHRI
jgi:hypothetical protein